jgi:hypothetical protein
VSGHLYDVAASNPEHWGPPVWGGVQHGTGRLPDQQALREAVDFVVTWAKGHSDELDVLFDQAGRQRRRWHLTPTPPPPE